jgi:DNA-binding PadR family transcriptional regulator
MRSNSRRTLTPLALVVLRLLHERAMHPYEMQQLIRDRAIDQVVKVRAGSLYHSVERLHRLGLIEQVETGREGRRPERTVYSITDVGRDEYTTNLRELVRQPHEEYPVFAAAIEMLYTLDRDDAVHLLEQRSTALEASVAAYEQVAASLAKRGVPRLATIEVEFCQALCRAELAWVRQLIEDIRSTALPWTRDICGDIEESTP